MRSLRTAALACLLVTACLSTAHADCTCPPTPALTEEFDASYMVFSGRVLSIEPDVFSSTRNVVMFTPLARWKGPLTEYPRLLTPNTAAGCAGAFVVGQDYLVFATLTFTGITYTPAGYVTSCGRSGPLAGHPDLAQLPSPVLPVAAGGRSWGTLKTHHR